MGNKEQAATRLLVAFRFSSMDKSLIKDILMSYFDSIDKEEIENLANSGWRGKLLASIYCAIVNYPEYADWFKDLLFKEVSGRPIKGYLVALYFFLEKEVFLDVLNRFLNDYESKSYDSQWIIAMYNILTNSKESSPEQINLECILSVVRELRSQKENLRSPKKL